MTTRWIAEGFCHVCARPVTLGVDNRRYRHPNVTAECPLCEAVFTVAEAELDNMRPRVAAAQMTASLLEGITLINSSNPPRDVVYPEGRYHGD